jgi:hypothetical protein
VPFTSEQYVEVKEQLEAAARKHQNICTKISEKHDDRR